MVVVLNALSGVVCRGSDKALKYLKRRFELKHVKVQNLTLIVSSLQVYLSYPLQLSVARQFTAAN